MEEVLKKEIDSILQSFGVENPKVNFDPDKYSLEKIWQ